MITVQLQITNLTSHLKPFTCLPVKTYLIDSLTSPEIYDLQI
jgi:hypothetical protein